MFPVDTIIASDVNIYHKHKDIIIINSLLPLGHISNTFNTADAESFARAKTSGLVPALVHGCSALRFLLRSGEEGGLNCKVKSFSKVFSAFARDPCVFSLFLGVLCNKFVPPLLT
jgi:hypothetical protein